MNHHRARILRSALRRVNLTQHSTATANSEFERPFAFSDTLTLVLTPRLESRWTIWDWGRYDFNPAEVVSIQRFGLLPLIAWGIRVNHNRTDLPRRVVFCTLGSRDKIIAAISIAGFVPAGEEG